MNGLSYKRNNRFFKLTLLISLLFHAFFLHLKISSHQNSKDLPQPPDIIELSQIPESVLIPPGKQIPNERRNQVVESEDAGNRELDPNATLLSDKNQTAQQQMRAKKSDDFLSGTGSGEKTKPLSPQDLDNSVEDESLSIPDESSTKTKKHWSQLSLQDLSLNGDGNPSSASDDYLPGVALGERTILSTREFKYFSYYNRIKDLLRQFWKPSIERAVTKLWGKGQMLRASELVTRVLVLLDDRGQIHKISKIGASGVMEIDQIAIEAFQAAAPFPNPPSALVEKDGFVRLNWDFILQTSAAPVIQYRPRGPSAFR